MKKTFTLLALCAFVYGAKAQDAPAPVYEAYGKNTGGRTADGLVPV